MPGYWKISRSFTDDSIDGGKTPAVSSAGKEGTTMLRLQCSHLKLSALCIFSQLLGCATVSYDQIADQQITSVTQEVNQQLTTWISQAREGKTPVTYEAGFYNKAEADILTLEIRMEASQDPATTKLIGIFKSLDTQLETVRTLHQTQNNLSAEFLSAELDLLSVQFATLTTFELSLKGNASSTSSGAKTTSTATSEAGGKVATSKANAVVSRALGAT